MWVLYVAFLLRSERWSTELLRAVLGRYSIFIAPILHGFILLYNLVTCFAHSRALLKAASRLFISLTWHICFWVSWFPCPISDLGSSISCGPLCCPVCRFLCSDGNNGRGYYPTLPWLGLFSFWWLGDGFRCVESRWASAAIYHPWRVYLLAEAGQNKFVCGLDMWKGFLFRVDGTKGFPWPKES